MKQNKGKGSEIRRAKCHWEERTQSLPNSLGTDLNLTSDGLRILFVFNALPDSWVIWQNDIASRLNWGVERMRSAIKCCVKAGYMKVVQDRCNGKFLKNSFEFDVYPSFLKECLPSGTNPCTVDPSTVSPPLTSIPKEHLPVLENTTTPDPEPPEKKKPGAVVVFSSLEDLGISDSLKIKVSKKHTESEVNDAVKRCLAWKGRPNDEVGIMTCLAKAAEWNDTVDKKTIVENNERYLKTLRKYDGVNMAFTLITVGTSYIEFACGRRVDVYESSMPDLQKTVDARLARIKELHEKD